MIAVQQHWQSHKRSTELTVSYVGLSKKQVFLFKFGSFGLVAGARIEAPASSTKNYQVDSENNNQGESNMIKEKFIKNP